MYCLFVQKIFFLYAISQLDQKLKSPTRNVRHLKNISACTYCLYVAVCMGIRSRCILREQMNLSSVCRRRRRCCCCCWCLFYECCWLSHHTLVLLLHCWRDVYACVRFTLYVCVCVHCTCICRQFLEIFRKYWMFLLTIFFEFSLRKNVIIWTNLIWIIFHYKNWLEFVQFKVHLFELEKMRKMALIV